MDFWIVGFLGFWVFWVFWVFGFLDFGILGFLCFWDAYIAATTLYPCRRSGTLSLSRCGPLVAGSACKIWRSVSFCFAARLNDEWRAFSTLLIKQSAQHSLRDCPHFLVLVPVRELRYPEWTLHFTRGSLRVDSSLCIGPKPYYCLEFFCSTSCWLFE